MITGTVRAASISATIAAAGTVMATPVPAASVSGQVAAGRVISGSVGATPLVGIVTVGGGAAPAGDSWNGTW